MPDLETVRTAVWKAVEEYNQTQEEAHRLPPDPQAVLLGKEGRLDSLGLVSLIIAVEQRLGQDFGVQLTLADEKALSQKNSPFRSLAALTDYALLRITEAGNA